MTDEEIVWALENCNGRLEIERCKICPFEDKGCRALMEYNAADLINRQKAEIERLKGMLIQLRETLDMAKCVAATQQGEIERLRNENSKE